MYTAFTLDGKTSYQFRKLSSLVKRLGGTEWKVYPSADPALADVVYVLHRGYGDHAALELVTRVRVPEEAIPYVPKEW